MSTIEDFVTVNITTQSQTPTQVGFGTPMVFAYHTAWTDKIRTYKKLGDMVADGLTSTGVGAGAYQAASKIFAQNPRVKELKVGRRTNAFTQVLHLYALTSTEGDIYTFDFGPIGTVPTTIVRTVPSSSSIDAEVAALKAAIDLLSLDVTVTVDPATPNATHLIITANTPGQLFTIDNPNVHCKVFDATLAPANIANDLSGIQPIDDDWYGVVLDSNSEAEIDTVAAWVETQFKVFAYNTADTDCGDAGVSTDVMSDLKGQTYFRTFGLFDSKSVLSYAGAGWIGEEFPFAPGSGTYALKTLKGVAVDVTNATNEGAILDKHGNVYTRVAGIPITQNGKTAAGEYIDITVGRDWLQARMKERVFGALTAVRKIPYTDTGVAVVVAQVKAQLQDGVVAGFLAADPAPIVTAPKVKDISSANKANRLLPDVTFSATLAGAIQAVEISGTISV